MRMETYRRMKRASLLVLGILLIVALAAYGGRFLPQQLVTLTSIATPTLLAGVAYAAGVFGQSHDEIVKRAVRETAGQAMEWCSSAREDAEKVAGGGFWQRDRKVQIQGTRCAQPSHEYLLKHLQGGVIQYDLFPINNTTDMPVFLKAGVLETGIRLKTLGFPSEFHTGDIPTDYVGDSGVVRDV